MMNLLLRYNTMSTLQQQIPTIFQLILNRMMTNKSPKFYKLVVHFFCVFANNYGGATLVTVLDSIQPNLLVMVINQVFTPHVTYICSTIDMTTGLELLLGCHSLLFKEVDQIPILLENNNNCWLGLLRNMICVLTSTSKLVSGKPTNAYLNLLGGTEEDSMLGGGGGGDFDNAYSKLQYANVTTPIQIIVNSNNIMSNPNHNPSESDSSVLFSFVCSTWVGGLNTILQSSAGGAGTHVQLRNGMASLTPEELQTLRYYKVNI